MRHGIAASLKPLRDVHVGDAARHLQSWTSDTGHRLHLGHSHQTGSKIGEPANKVASKAASCKHIWTTRTKLEGQSCMDKARAYWTTCEHHSNFARNTFWSAVRPGEAPPKSPQGAQGPGPGARGDPGAQGGPGSVEGPRPAEAGGPQRLLQRCVNKVGHPVNKIGHPVNTIGHPVNKVGHCVNKVGHPVNKVGHPVNKVGHRVSKVGHQPAV